MTAQVRTPKANVLTLPSAALGARAPMAATAYRCVARTGIAHARRITIGLDDQIQVEVRSGLKEGEQVVLAQARDEAATAHAPSK